MPGTNTLSNSRPFAAWIVMTLTESSADGCTGDHSCLSMPLHHVHVVQERAERQLALDRFERVHLVHERGEVPLGGGRRDLVRLGVQLRQEPRAPDDLTQELADRLARLDPQLGELPPELLEPHARIL